MQLQARFVMLELLSLARGWSEGCSSSEPFLSSVTSGVILPRGFSIGMPFSLSRPSIRNTCSTTARAVSIRPISIHTGQCHFFSGLVEHMRADQRISHLSNPQPLGWRSTFCH